MQLFSKINKKVIVATMMLCSCVCMSVPLFAATQEGETGPLKWVYEDTTKELVISGQGQMPDFGTVSWWTSAPWSKLAVDKLIIEEGVENIGAYAFYFNSTRGQNYTFKEVHKIGRAHV